VNKINQFFKANGKGLFLVLRYGLAKVAEWQSQVIHDELTGLYNRRFIQEAGKKELAKAFRYEWKGISYPLSIIRIDVDNFKRVNDEEGHLAGDKVLQQVAALLEKVCRESDIVGRTGGDEFTILLPDTTEEGAQVLMAKLKKIAKEELVSPKGKPIELSCGLAAKFSLAALEEEADVKMYQEKKSKGG